MGMFFAMLLSIINCIYSNGKLAVLADFIFRFFLHFSIGQAVSHSIHFVHFDLVTPLRLSPSELL